FDPQLPRVAFRMNPEGSGGGVGSVHVAEILGACPLCAVVMSLKHLAAAREPRPGRRFRTLHGSPTTRTPGAPSPRRVPVLSRGGALGGPMKRYLAPILGVGVALMILVPTTFAVGEPGSSVYANLTANRFPGGATVASAQLHFINANTISLDVFVQGN